uniref:Inter-alpha-trypsin inhibitor heavy chain family member 6 n=1 Tax=Pseudonaja textilis TaxID=8673 RepID=A0A670YGT6_PSETE
IKLNGCFGSFSDYLCGFAPQLIISSFFVRSTIVSRYAATRVWISMSNPHPEAKEAIFDLDLPRSAFISNFTITMNEKIYVAEVKEKHKAKKMDREMEKFRVSTSVEAGRKVAFELTYEELLQRHLGKYQHAISIRPQQLVRNLTVEVSISERTGIDHVQVLPLRTSRLMTNTLQGRSEADMPPSTRVEKGRHCAWIVFTPTLQEQESFSTSGIVGDFVVQYDVAMPDVSGDVQIYNGYFAHYFAPRGMPLLQKDVVFVIDISGSMYGTKLKQIKKAMHVILSDLHQDDHFNIVTFSDTVNVWKPNQSIQATSQNIRKAKDYASKMEADGWTDINAALLAAASLFNQSSSMDGKVEKEPRIPLIIFLTDGEATSGVTAGSRILTNAQRALKGTISLFGLAFGDDADYGLLRRLSLENRGVARRIYEDADATLQLKGFYDEIASPLLYDVELSYLDGVAEGLTQNLFPNYFQGSELVVVGRVKPGATKLQVRTTGQGQEGPLNLDNDISTNTTQAVPFGCLAEINKIGHFVQRLWAYFTIQDLLQARFRANDTAARRLLTEKATNLSIKYNFVTPVTSLVVVRPEEARDGNHYEEFTGPPCFKNVLLRDTLCFFLAVDGDPHFVIKLPRSQGNLCFTLDGRLGDILRLVSDPATGLSVNGHLMGAPSRPGHEERPRTYLDVITIVVERPRASYVVNITQKGVTLYGEEVLVLPLIQQATISKPPLAISMWPEANITVQIGSTIEFLVLLHHYSHPTVLQLDHLGFYIMKGQGLSASAGGLLGQFQNSNISLSPDPSHGGKVAWMQSGANKVLLTEVSKVLKDSVQRAHEAKCWLVKRKDVEELLGASYSSYLASNLLEI